MTSLQTFPAFVLSVIAKAIGRVTYQLSRVESKVEKRLDVAAEVAFQAEAQALRHSLAADEQAIETIRKMLRDAEANLQVRKDEVLTAVWAARSKAIGRQTFFAESPLVPQWVYALEDELYPNGE
jgi:predicted transcriptional regulator